MSIRYGFSSRGLLFLVSIEINAYQAMASSMPNAVIGEMTGPVFGLLTRDNGSIVFLPSTDGRTFFARDERDDRRPSSLKQMYAMFRVHRRYFFFSGANTPRMTGSSMPPMVLYPMTTVADLPINAATISS